MFVNVVETCQARDLTFHWKPKKLKLEVTNEEDTIMNEPKLIIHTILKKTFSFFKMRKFLPIRWIWKKIPHAWIRIHLKSDSCTKDSLVASVEWLTAKQVSGINKRSSLSIVLKIVFCWIHLIIWEWWRTRLLGQGKYFVSLLASINSVLQAIWLLLFVILQYYPRQLILFARTC